MRRLGLLVIAILLVVHTTATAIPVFAQNADRIVEKQQGTYDYFYDQAITMLDNNLKSLQDVKTALEKTQNEPNKDVIIARINKRIDAYQSLKSAYINTFNKEKESGTLPAKSQTLAIAAGNAEFDKKWGSLTAPEKTEPRINGIKQTFDRQWSGLVNQAEQISRGNISAGSAEASTLGNATAVSTAGTSAAGLTSNSDTKCTALWNASIKDCIDAGFTWFIKNTVLQIAGFLVWLTGNMMNFAIQTGILEFSKWAPSSLYPLWIVVRQIVSLMVVFAGLWLGFMYIIGREETFGRYIGWVVVFALFVNFSYPITRALIDVSNVVSLNIYSSAVGTGPLESTGTTAGSEIMNKLGLQGLILSATNISAGQTGLINSINSTPGALIAVVFVIYAAYIFFVATAILAARTAVLVFLTVASPLLLIDSVVPKLGEVAMKMRKLYFEQLVVAPIFMIMLALTLKFMDIFKSTNQATGQPGPLSSVSSVANAGALQSNEIGTFFGILMMLIMLHITLKVTRSVAGNVGQAATNWLGKVGGFGLAAATAGTGLLARGTIGQLALNANKSGWMDRQKDTVMGRGLYNLTNSLAKSSFDTRNIGFVNKGLAAAGVTGGLGITMQQGSSRTFVQAKEDREKRVVEFGSNIRDDATRDNYFNKANKGFVYSKVNEEKLKQTERDIQKKRQDAFDAYTKAKPEDRDKLLSQAGDDYVLRDKLKKVDPYYNIKNSDKPEDAAAIVNKKADALMNLNDADLAAKLIDNDPFSDIKEGFDVKLKEQTRILEAEERKERNELKQAEEAYKAVDRNDAVAFEKAKEELKYSQEQLRIKTENKNATLEKMKKDHERQIETQRQMLRNEYRNRTTSVQMQGTHTDVDITDVASIAANRRRTRQQQNMSGAGTATQSNQTSPGNTTQTPPTTPTMTI